MGDCVWVLLNGKLPSQGPCQALGKEQALLTAHLIPAGRNTGSWFKVAMSFEQQRASGARA